MVYYVFGQDVSLVGARTSLNSLTKGWQEREGLVPIMLDDPEARGDCQPSGGAANVGDVISGAFSLYSERLCNALREFGIEFTAIETTIRAPGSQEPILGYFMVLGIADADCLTEELDDLEYFEIDAKKTNEQHMFDVEHKLRVIDEKFKMHLESLNLEGVFMVPTSEYGGALEMRLTMG